MSSNVFNASKVKDDCVAWIREFFERNGKTCNAVVGISGGKDSSVVAALCAEALGKDRVIGVLMPNRVQDDIEYAYDLCKCLGIKHYVVDIGDSVDGLLKSISAVADFEISTQTKVNLSPRIRMSTLYAVAQSCNGMVANTCNLSESYVGYATLYGDQAGSFSPLDRLTVTEVKEIGRVLGLPEKLVNKAPSDGLCGKTDEDNLGFTYEELDIYIRTGKIENEEHKRLIDAKYAANKFKTEIMHIPTFEYKPE